MKTRLKTWWIVTVCAGCLAGIAVAATQEDEAAKGERFVSSLTIFPVPLAGKPSRRVGEVVGVILEKEGFRNIAVAETPFVPPEGGDLEKTALAFGDFIARREITTDYALFGAILGSRQRGVQAIHGVLVDRKGRVVWKRARTRDDAESPRRMPRDPMACCVFLASELRPMMIPASQEELAKGDGPLTRRGKRQSGIPPRKEFEAMQGRLDGLKKAGADATLVVFPIRVQKQVDRKGADQLAERLNREAWCKARVSETPLWLDIKPNANEQRVLWDLARAFQAHVRRNAPDADYALYGDYLMDRDSGRVGAVHFVICDRKGDWVIVDFQNSHHADFKSVEPRSLEDCNRLLLRRLGRYLKRSD